MTHNDFTLGVLFVRYINEMQNALIKLNPNLQVWSPAVYTFDRIPNRVDQWGEEWDHDWPTWRAMLPLYLDELT